MSRVTIGMPVYNGARYLAHALECLVSQLFDDIEIVISDNGSRDATEEMCRSYADGDARIRYIRHEQTTEASVNFSRVLAEATSPYFMWAAHDDGWSENYVGSLLAALESDVSAVSAQGECVFMDAQGEVIQRGLPNGQLAAGSCVTRVSYVMGAGPSNRYNNMFMYGLHRTSMLRKFGIRPVFFARGESRYNELPLLFSLGGAGRLISVPEAQFYYRFHSDQYGAGHLPLRDAVRLEIGLVASVPVAVWRGCRSPLGCVVACAEVAALRAKYLAGLAKTVLGNAIRQPSRSS
jgi:glycosyltransferase involved in cell wall biosynthesis